MPRVPRLCLALVVSLMALPARASAEGPEPQLVSGPGSRSLGDAAYVPQVTVVGEDRRLTYTNIDIDQHNVVAEDFGPDDQPWCGAYDPGKCPLFWTPLLALTESAPVQGLENVRPGIVYVYDCTRHSGMRGRLVAVA